jgi:glycosyltransferase involved in cell wall biosynthesis
MTAVCWPFRKLSLLVAAYNEEATLRRRLTRVLAAPLPDGLEREVIEVDDGSSDGTWTLAEELAAQVRVFRQPENRGKGAALRRAISAMTGDVTVFQDADLEYGPQDYGRLLKPILAGKAEVVYSSRFTGEERKLLYFWHTVGNRVLRGTAWRRCGSSRGFG